MAATLLDKVVSETKDASNGLPDRALSDLAGVFQEAASRRDALHASLRLGHGVEVLRRMPLPTLVEALALAASKVKIEGGVRKNLNAHLPGVEMLSPADDTSFLPGQLVIEDYGKNWDRRPRLSMIAGLIEDRQEALFSTGEAVAYHVRGKASDSDRKTYLAPSAAGKSALKPAPAAVTAAFSSEGRLTMSFLLASLRRNNRYIPEAAIGVKNGRLVVGSETLRAMVRPSLLAPLEREDARVWDIVVAAEDELALVCGVSYDAKEDKLRFELACLEFFRRVDDGGASCALRSVSCGGSKVPSSTLRLADPAETGLFLATLHRFA